METRFSSVERDPGSKWAAQKEEQEAAVTTTTTTQLRKRYVHGASASTAVLERPSVALPKQASGAKSAEKCSPPHLKAVQSPPEGKMTREMPSVRAEVGAVTATRPSQPAEAKGMGRRQQQKEEDDDEETEDDDKDEGKVAVRRCDPIHPSI